MTEVINETDYGINEAEFSAPADYVPNRMRVSSDTEVDIIFIESESMEDLRVRWLDLPGPTDIIGFSMDELRPGAADHPTPPGMLGGICTYPQITARQAIESGHSAAEKMLLLATHDMPHLLGYDHATDAECEVMFTLRRRLLLTFLASR